MIKSDKEMKEVAGFVSHEWKQFSWAASVIVRELPLGTAPDEWCIGTGDQSEPEDALVEVYLLHARVLRDFFSRSRSELRSFNQTDVLAENFFDAPAQWNQPTFNYLLEQRHTERLNRALAHLSYHRIDYEVTGKNWNTKVITAEISDAWKAFFGSFT